MIVRLFTQVWNLLKNKKVAFTTKLIYLLGISTYTLAPDFLPFLPFDDIFVIYLASRIFVSVAQKEAGLTKKSKIFSMFKEKKKFDYDVNGDFIDEEDNECNER